jgi:hypothetical protein
MLELNAQGPPVVFQSDDLALEELTLPAQFTALLLRG